MNDNIQREVITLPPFKRFCMTIGELPSSYVETMTYYEMVLWFTKYLGETIIPTVNNNAEAVTELQNLFVELQSYVNNYFDNLDVQEEINNKLDEMAEDGTLSELIFFNNVINVTRPGHNLTPMLFDGTDETTKLQAIIDWALQNNGAKILLPTGSCQISKINIIGHGALNIEIIGMGESTKLYSITNNNDTMFNIQTDGDGQIDNLILNNFAIIRETSQTEITGIYLNNVCNNCEIKNMLIKGFEIGLHTYECWTLKIYNNNFYRNNYIGLYITSSTHNSSIFGNKISFNNNIGLYIKSSYNVNVENNDIEGNDGIGIQIYNTRDLSILKNYIENNGVNDSTNYNEIYIEGNTINTNILYNYINANSVNNVIKINPTTTQLDISNNVFVSGNNNKKIIVCTATATTQIYGKFVNNSYSSYGTGFAPFDFQGSQFIVENISNNQHFIEANKTIYNKLMVNDGKHIIRTGENGIVKFELNYDTNGDPIINVTSGEAGAEVYRKIITLMSNLNLLINKSLSFGTLHPNSDITDNNCLFVATNGDLRFRDKDGNYKKVTLTDV